MTYLPDLVPDILLLEDLIAVWEHLSQLPFFGQQVGPLGLMNIPIIDNKNVCWNSTDIIIFPCLCIIIP